MAVMRQRLPKELADFDKRESTFFFLLPPSSMSARQPFFPAPPVSESQGTTQDFKQQKTFSMDPSNPLHTSSPAAKQSESIKTAFSVPGPFSSNGTTSVKASGLGAVSKKNPAHNMSQRVEKDRKGSLNSVGFLDVGNIRPGTADPHSETHPDRTKTTTLELRHGFGYQKTSRRSIGHLDPNSIVRPGTAVPQSNSLHGPAASLDIRAPIPKPATLSSSTFISQNTFSDRSSENDVHISTTEAKHGASRKVDDVDDSTFQSSTKGNPFNQTGPQRVPIEQQFGQYNVSEVDFNASSTTSHEVTADGRLKMNAPGPTKKRHRDDIQEDGDGSYWVENHAKRHKNRRHEGLETRGYTRSPPFSPRPDRTSPRARHPEGDIRQRLPDARESPRSPRLRERRTVSPVNEYHMPSYDQPPAQQVTPDGRNAFDKLLGRNTDIFVQQNTEKYDRLVKKWSECTEEEWVAGAEVIAGKYVKIVSYVKDAMIAKINAFANIQADIGLHLSDLGERGELLNIAKKKLIMESGNALG